MAQPDKPTIPTQRTVEQIDRAIEIVRMDIVAAEDRGNDSARLRGILDGLMDERRAARQP